MFCDSDAWCWSEQCQIISIHQQRQHLPSKQATLHKLQTTCQQTTFPNPISEHTKQQWEEVITLFHPGSGAVKQSVAECISSEKVGLEPYMEQIMAVNMRLCTHISLSVLEAFHKQVTCHNIIFTIVIVLEQI